MPDSPTPATHYRRPGWFTNHVFNPLVRFATRHGVSIWGSRVLEVRGRKTGEPRHTAVNLLEIDGRHYLVSPRGHSQWVRNVRAGDGRIATLVGRTREEWRARELDDADKVPVLRAYLRRWKAEVGVFFDGTTADSSDDELAAIAQKHPAFLLEPIAAAGPSDPASPTT